MCGIAGIVDLGAEAVDPGRVERMCELLVHRGPDDGGVWSSAGVALGNRRLAVIDLTPAGHMPMGNEDGSLWITYNGEVYNHPELREELRARGHEFRSRTDSEVVLHAFEEEGPGAFRRLNGMFALAIWSQRDRRLTLARDRIGKKPLYYAHDAQGRVAFASELRALLAGADWLSLDVDRAALEQFFVFGDVPAPLTPFTAVRKLRPGEWLSIDASGTEHGRYWSPDELQPRTEAQSWEEALDALDAAVRPAVARRLLADVPVGAFLSGGVDSTCVVAAAAAAAGAGLKTFSVGYEDERYNESRHARLVAQHLGTDHHELLLREGDVDLVEVMSSFDEPFYDHSAVPTYYVSKLARTEVTVVLTGDGGDELFAGYPHLLVQAKALKAVRAAGERAARGEDGAFDRLPLPVLRALRRTLGRLGAEGAAARVGGAIGYRVTDNGSPASALWPRVSPAIRRLLLPGAEGADDADWHVPAGDDLVGALARADLRNYLPNDILVKVDRMTMRHSLEGRAPLLDPNVVELALGLPTALKLRDGEQKALLRAYVRRLVGDARVAEAVLRPKHGFRFPLAAHVDVHLRPRIEEAVRDPAFHADLGLARAGVERILRDHYRRRRGGKAVWLLFCLALWWDATLAGRRVTA